MVMRGGRGWKSEDGELMRKFRGMIKCMYRRVEVGFGKMCCWGKNENEWFWIVSLCIEEKYVTLLVALL